MTLDAVTIVTCTKFEMLIIDAFALLLSTVYSGKQCTQSNNHVCLCMADDAVAVCTNTLLYFVLDDMHYGHLYIGTGEFW